MPTPNTDESHDDFISRCIPVVLNDNTAKSQPQAVAVCESLWEDRTLSRQLRLLKVNLPNVELRTETFEGDEYTVVPVVALVGNTVVHSSSSATPELIPESVLNIAPASWDGRPVVYTHPDDGSANTPENLESMKIGYIFNTEFDDGKLKMEA
jgi:hypothetical protein